jgi:O-antigen/teichoic acid export membrane protein
LGILPRKADGVSLRRRALQGGAYMTVRHLVVAALGMIGQPLLARMVGPASYGLWVAARQLSEYVRGVCGWGIDVYLIRKEGELSRQAADQAFTLLALLGLVGSALTLVMLPSIQHWTRLNGLSWVLAAIIATMPLSLVSLVPFAQLERALDYRALAKIEVGGRVLFYAASLALAVSGWGVWALVSAIWVEQLFTLVMLHLAAAYVPRLHHERTLAKEMTGYGLSYAASTWVYQLRALVVPFIVGRYAGPTAVGYVGLADRLVVSLTFVKSAAWRLSMAVLAKVQGDRVRLGRAVSEGAILQALALAPLLLLFRLVLPYLVPWLFGFKWKPVEHIYPFIATGYLVNSIFSLDSSALYVLRRNGQVAVFHLLHVILFAGAAFFLVRRLSWIGYGWAEIAALPSYVLLHRYAAAEVGELHYAPVLLFALAAGLALFGEELGWPAGIGLVALALWPGTWKFCARYLNEAFASNQ